jgi:polyhydroxyalkanoate synthesis regulator phasin
VNENPLCCWLKDATFQIAYREARRAVVQQAVTQGQQATGKAAETLRSVMQDTEAPASSWVAAARTILDMSLRTIEIEELEQRIADLESAQEHR